MKLRWMCFTAVLLSLALLAAPAALAQNGNSTHKILDLVVDPDSVAYGRTFAQWTAAWNQWADSIPTSTHPLFDNGDCSVGQTGDVWFLGGKFCANGATCDWANVVRSCTIPAGKALFMPILDNENSAIEMGNPNAQINDLRASVEASTQSFHDMSFEIDGVSVPHLQEKYMVQSVAFAFTMPEDNFFTAVGVPGVTAGTYFPAVDQGVYVMLSPLPRGLHVIHFHGEAGTWVLDVTYNLTVKK